MDNKAWTDDASMDLMDNALMDKYDVNAAEKLGQGAYGVVYKVRNKSTNETVAVKKILKSRSGGVPSFALREMSALKQMDHENIVRLLDVVEGDQSLYLVFEYIPSDLSKYMNSSRNRPMDKHIIKRFLRHMLLGICQCHSRGVLHRDLKPQNLLIDEETNTLKVADFGLARVFDIPAKRLTPTVVTFLYKGPELLLRATYLTPIDMWSIGCIFAEMVNGSPLFGEAVGEIMLLPKIFEKLGTPTENTWPGVTSLLISSENVPLTSFPPKDIATVVPDLEKAGCDLLQKMLYLDPSKRISAKDALEHEYFKDVT